MANTLNTYISISFMSYTKDPQYNSGRLYTSNKAAKLDLHLDIPYEQAKQEMAKLMLRTGKLPDVIGKDDDSDSVMYMLTAFLD
jgi:hypothetical protein